MRIFIFGLGLYGVLLLFGFSASAQEAESLSEPQEPQAVTEAEANPAVIIDVWDIDPFERVNGVPSGSCLMSASYSNGLELAFKGRSGRLSALRIKADRRETRGDIKGFVSLGLNGQNYDLQARTTGNQADASLMTVPAAAELLQDNAVFRISVGGQDYRFSNAGFAAGYEALLDCLGDNSMTTLKVVDHSRFTRVSRQAQSETEQPEDISNQNIQKIEEAVSDDPLLPTEIEGEDETPRSREMPLAMALASIIPSGYSFHFDGRVDGMAPVTWTEEGDWQARLQQAAASQGYLVMVEEDLVRIATEQPKETATQKNEVEATVEEEQESAAMPAAPTPLVEAQAEALAIVADDDALTDRRPPVKANTQWTAQKGERVDAVLHRWARQAGVRAQIELDNPPAVAKDFALTGAFEVAVNELLEASSQNRAVKPSAVLTHGGGKVTHVSGYEGGVMAKAEQSVGNSWRALEGSNLRKVLQRWSIQNGIDFIWEAEQMFYIPQSVNTTTDFPEAVALLLSQFEGQPIRPTAILNTDPQTDKTALIIRTNRQSAE